REFVSEMFKSELQSIRECARVRYSFGQIGKKLLHFGRGSNKTFRVNREQASGILQLPVMANAGEDVEDFAIRCRRVGDAIRCQNGKTQRACNRYCRLIASFLAAIKVPLQFDINILPSE